MVKTLMRNSRGMRMALRKKRRRRHRSTPRNRIMCSVCGSLFPCFMCYFLAAKKSNLHIYCSKKCSEIGRMKSLRLFKQKKYPKEEVSCRQCHKKFLRRSKDKFGNPKVHRKKHCSRKCYYKSQIGQQRSGKLLRCKTCNKEIWVKTAVLKRSKSGVFFCKYSCFTRHWKKNLLPIMLKKRCRKPNKPEKELASKIRKFGFVYVGDCKFMIGTKNPDYIHKSKKKIVELFGDYWHESHEVPQRKKFFRDNGYECLVVWLSDFRNKPNYVVKRIAQFAK